jgi:hypothetical protein
MELNVEPQKIEAINLNHEHNVIYSAEIYYNGIGCNFRNYFGIQEFRRLIKKVLKNINFENFENEYFNSVIKDPINCDLDLLLEFTGATKLK